MLHDSCRYENGPSCTSLMYESGWTIQDGLKIEGKYKKMLLHFNFWTFDDKKIQSKTEELGHFGYQSFEDWTSFEIELHFEPFNRL